MGGRPYGLALAGPFALDGVCVQTGPRQQTGTRLIVTFALAELLVAGGERVGIPGLMNPTASRSVIDKMAQAMLHDDAARLSLPPSFVPSALAEIVVLSDFWSPMPK